MALNPVERRLLDLRDHWEAFRADVSRRLLVWQVPDDSLRLLSCFFEAQKHETDYSTQDLFIGFSAPFFHSIQYSRALKEALSGQYAASADDLKRQGVVPDWQFAPEQYADTATGVLRSLCSFGSKHHEIIGHLAAVLLPSDVSNDDAFASWLLRLLAADIPERLRFVVIETLEAPRLTDIVGGSHPLVYVDAPRIDALATAQETFAEEGAVGPAAVFRNFLMGLVTLIERGSADQVKAKALDAVAFARKQQWPDQEVAVAMLVAGAFLKEMRLDETAATYRRARHMAEGAAAAGHPAGQQLVLQTWFGEAGALLAGGSALEAAGCYDRAAVVAQQIPNLILAIEALRMGSFCHARVGGTDAALERGEEALKLGRMMKAEARGMTTLPIVAIDLLRIIEPDRVTEMESIKHRLDAHKDQARAAIEARAVALEQSDDRKAFAEAEAELARETACAEAEAAGELDAVAALGSQQFRQMFAVARDLLGQDWPIGSAAALPRAPKPADVAASGVAAQ